MNPKKNIWKKRTAEWSIEKNKNQWRKIRVRLDTAYFAKTENWKYCNKIIFKYVNSAVRPIFNEKITEK